MIFLAANGKAPILICIALTGIVALASASNDENNYVGLGMTQLMDADGNFVGLINDHKVSDNDEPEIDNKLLSYEPMMNNIKQPKINLADLVKGRNLEKESIQIVAQKDSPKLVTMNQKKFAPAIVPSLPVMEQKEPSLEADANAAREETIKLIAHNSREVRLMGPEEKEVEMKDDAATKMAVALENLKKEAGDVWDQVNTKLDKGWTDFKTMVDGAVDSAKKKSSGPAKPITMDDIVAGADETVKTIKDQAEIAGTKIKGFFNNLGINV